ncbi:hypothetical protein KY285_001835 [Solanum tuberosum]|nr:hypothetical protein KY285_001835 [Solanum tuberosum]
MSGEVQMSSEKQPRRGVSCTTYFDALWFCYYLASPPGHMKLVASWLSRIFDSVPIIFSYLLKNPQEKALIPKKAGASELKDFRPISLITGIYKVIAMLLTERLKKVVDRLVNKHQMAFIKGRQIMDAALIASECVNSRMKGDKPSVMCKLDIEKAYDHVNWNFLMSILRQMGFGEKWLGWINFCITTVKFSVLVNGEPVGFFPSGRDLRQGNPLSPFLFVLAMEGFDSMMRRAIQHKRINGFQIGGVRGQYKEICHLLYADDTVIFCEPTEEQISHIRLLLLFFESTSGLKVNWRKSNLFPIKEVLNIQSLADILGCKVEHLPTVYLGIPLGYQHEEIVIWDGIIEKAEKRLGIIEKAEKRLTRWKTQYLSIGGRLTLIKSVLDSLPTYVMSLFPLPKKVLKKLDKLRRNFLWHGCKENNGYNLVKWDTTLNNSGRWEKTKFWEDAWNNQSPLKDIFSDLFTICNNPEATVKECWTEQGWDLSLRRFLNDWEVDRVANLLHEIGDFTGTTSAPDSMRWKHKKDGNFTVKRVYETTQNEPCLSTLQIYSAAGLDEVKARARRDGGKSFHIASGGLCGERNSRRFEDKSNSIHRVRWNCIVSLFFWCKQRNIEELELVDMLGSLRELCKHRFFKDLDCCLAKPGSSKDKCCTDPCL